MNHRPEWDLSRSDALGFMNDIRDVEADAYHGTGIRRPVRNRHSFSLVSSSTSCSFLVRSRFMVESHFPSFAQSWSRGRLGSQGSPVRHIARSGTFVAFSLPSSVKLQIKLLSRT